MPAPSGVGSSSPRSITSNWKRSDKSWTKRSPSDTSPPSSNPPLQKFIAELGLDHAFALRKCVHGQIGQQRPARGRPAQRTKCAKFQIFLELLLTGMLFLF